MKESDPRKPNYKKKRVVRILVFVIIIALFAVMGVYLGTFYRAAPSAQQALESDAQVKVDQSQKGQIVFAPQGETTVGLIFYPGAKVATEAYAPLMQRLAKQGILCVLVKMPFHLAIFDVNAADGIPQQYPQIGHWYMGGHSLGGAMAASYLEEHVQEYDGLILLAAYSTEDLSGTDLDVVSVYGTEDEVLNHEKYEKYRENLPPDLKETVIDGGCHAYFGDYGEQRDDGVPTISREEQMQIAAEEIRENLIQ